MNRLLALGICLLVAACTAPAIEPHDVAGHPKRVAANSSVASIAASELLLYAMDCGDLEFTDVDEFADDGSMKGMAQNLVDPCYLIRHPRGDLLWDSGIRESIADMADGMSSTDFPLRIVVKKKLSAQLDELGLMPADIEYLSFSHMHFDHTGNANLFASSTWIVDVDERKAMFSDQARAGEDFAGYSALENVKTILIEGDASHDVFADGSVVIHQAPGHTPGHAVLLVRLPQSGPLLLSGDLWHLRESRERRLVPSFNVDREQTLASMDKVEALARDTGARIVRQHVAEDFATLPAFPQPLR